MWKVEITKSCEKNIRKFHNKGLMMRFLALVSDLQQSGPMQPNWPNFSKLSPRQYHCHIKKGHPTIVVCWKMENKTLKIIEVYYVGTHQKAPY